MAYFQPAAAKAHILAEQPADRCQVAVKVADGKLYLPCWQSQMQLCWQQHTSYLPPLAPDCSARKT